MCIGIDASNAKGRCRKNEETYDFSSDTDALNATISREDMVYILVGAAKANGEELKAIEGVEEYISDYDAV